MAVENFPTIVSSDSDFVQSIVVASKNRVNFAEIQNRPLNSAERCQLDSEQIAQIANVAFWSSIAVEEGRSTRGVLCIVSPDEIPSALAFSSPLRVTIANVVALSTAAPNSGLAIHSNLDASLEPEIWGIVDLNRIPFHALVFRIVDLATVIASIAHSNVIALIEKGRMYDSLTSNEDYCIQLIAAALNVPFPDQMRKASILLKIVASMFQQGHGGALVVGSATTKEWVKEINIKYEFDKQGISLLKNRLAELDHALQEAREAEGLLTTVPQNLIPLRVHIASILTNQFYETLKQIGNLTAIDGAVVIDEELSLFGFGAKLAPKQDNFSLYEIDMLSQSFEQGTNKVELSDIGGTRHQSAARFVYQHNDALVFVASQDGHVTLFVWETARSSVLALRNLHHMIWESKF